MPKKLARRITLAEKSAPRVLAQDASCVEELREADPGMATLSDYILRTTGSPLWKNTQSEYLPIGETMWARMLEELPKAKRFIFMEYFILEEGVMWEPIFQILREKAAEGVDVRFMYDDLGSIMTLPANYAAKLRKAGIKCALFNPFQPHLNSMMNYRDHRKITVIDGNVGFCGGINIADEYINDYEKHGHWKDTGVLLRGDGVWGLTAMFLSLWNFTVPTDHDFARYRPTQPQPCDGFVQPFGDSPLDQINVSEETYMQIINRATRYVYITTPYLILDSEMITALQIAARSGVDVRIITPTSPTNGSCTRPPSPSISRCSTRGCASMNTPPASSTRRCMSRTTRSRSSGPPTWTTAASTCTSSAGSASTSRASWPTSGTTS